MIYLASVTHDIRTNSIEATWLEDTGTELRRVKCHTYSASQRDIFVADVGKDAERYLTAAGWTPEFCAEFKAEEERAAAELAAAEQAKVDAEAQAKAAADKAAFDAEVQRQADILRAAKAVVG